MLWFDLIIIALACTITYISKPSILSRVVTIYLLTQFICDIIYIDFGLYQYVLTEQFYLTKGLIVFAGIALLYRYYAPKWIIIVFICEMLYNYGLWNEEVLNQSGYFDLYFLPCAMMFMILQLAFLIGVNNVRKFFTRIWEFCVKWYMHIHFHIISDLYAI